jgi:general secretion pathway protein E
MRYIMESIGTILLKNGALTEEELEEAIGLQTISDKSLDQILVQQGKVKETQILRALSTELNIAYLEHIDDDDIDREAMSELPLSFLKGHRLLPLKKEKGVVPVATCDPLNLHPLDDIRLLLGEPEIRPIAARGDEIIGAINRYYGSGQTDTAEEIIQELGKNELKITEGLGEEVEDLLDMARKPPIIKLVNSLILQALKERASDIHLEPREKDLRVRYRIDGVLYNRLASPKQYQAAIISRVKVMSSLNIAERRLPQDGRISIKIVDRDIDIRVSVVPTFFGERVVMRLLDKSAAFFKLEDLGLQPDKLKALLKLIHTSHGIILVTGPTGSGKTTTLYSALDQINTPDKNIITVEDPIEYQLKGISQIQVKPRIGLTFANGLRSIVRQDPDIIMVGEVRDLETAEIAIHASLTGHLVFSTLHTNDAAGAITRLQDIGIEPYLVSSSVIAVMAQRLVRTICPRCKESYRPSAQSLSEIGLEPSDLAEGALWRGKGCPYCLNSGYRGRTGIFEVLLMDEDIRSLVSAKTDSNIIKRKSISKGMATLRDDGATKVMAGITTIEEILRVTQDELG